MIAIAKRVIGLVPWQAWALGALISVAGVYHWRAVDAANEAGKTAAFDAMNKLTEEIGDAAEKGRARVRLCVAVGGVWNSAARKCERDASDRGN